MFETIESWLVLGVHASIVGLHGIELHHANTLTLASFIGMAYMAASSIELYHVRKKIKDKGHH